jgi:hypothetical protein
MSCAADLSTMTDVEAHAACEALRSFLRIVPLSSSPVGGFTPPTPGLPAGDGDLSEVIA